MKSVLIISEHIFPKQTPRSHRATELAIQLAKVGYRVTLCAVLGSYDYSIFQSKYNLNVINLKLKWQYAPNTSDLRPKRYLLDKILNKLFHKLFEYPLIEFYFKIPKLLNRIEKHDVLISIAVPHQIHWGCANAKQKFPLKFPKIWIADCGDPYINFNNTEFYKMKFNYFNHLFCRLSNFITVPVEDAVSCYHKIYKNKIKVIPQGFNFNIQEKINLSPINKIPTFLYAGNFYKNFRDPNLLFKFLNSINLNFKFVIYCSDLSLIKHHLTHIKNKVETRHLIERSSLLLEMKKFDFLVNFENKNLKGQVPSKLIDYAISNRPIINLSTKKFDKKKFLEFLNGNYENRYVVKNLKQYQIGNVANQFINLAQDD